MDDGTEMPVEGVTALDHTADVGIEVHAQELDQLLTRAAEGMVHLILEAPPPDAPEVRTVRASGDEPAALLRNWLREVLYLHEVEGLTYAGADVSLEGERLEAHVRLGRSERVPAREIKGVTLHGLVAEPTQEGGWRARVIFDV